MNLGIKALAVFTTFLLSSCALVNPTAHHQFIGGMNAIANNSVTLEQLGNKEFTGDTPASKKYLKHKESGENNTTIYHYAKPNLWNKLCYYHFIVNNKTNLVIGWGFDHQEKINPKKRCGSSG